MFKIAQRKGQALIEVLIAVSVLTVGLLGIVTLLNRALSLNRVVSDNYTATYLAAEGIEVAKNIIDGNIAQGNPVWNSGIISGTYAIDYDDTALTTTYAGSPLYFNAITERYSYDLSGRETPFRREVTVELVGQNEIIVSSEVRWITRGGGSFSVELEDHFYNWRP